MADLICKSCQKKINVGDIRADKSGSGWICLVCYKTQHPNVYGNPEKKEASIKQPAKLQRSKYYCADCGYKFSKEINYQGKCPYCNRYSVRVERDAETLIQESVKDEAMGFIKTRSNIFDF